MQHCRVSVWYYPPSSGRIFDPSTSSTVPDPVSYVTQLRAVISKLWAVPPRSQQRQHTYIPNTLASPTHAFVRCDAVRKSLQQPYNGPFKIINRSDKHYTLLVNGKKEVISIDRLKPAYLSSDSSPTPHLLVSKSTSLLPTNQTPLHALDIRFVHAFTGGELCREPELKSPD